MSWIEFRARPGPRARGLHPLRVDDALTEEDLTDHSHDAILNKAVGRVKVIVMKSCVRAHSQWRRNDRSASGVYRLTPRASGAARNWFGWRRSIVTDSIFSSSPRENQTSTSLGNAVRSGRSPICSPALRSQQRPRKEYGEFLNRSGSHVDTTIQ